MYMAQAFQEAWKAACNSTGNVKLVIPKRTYFLSPVKFRGPCANVQSITVQLQASFKFKIHKSIFKFSLLKSSNLKATFAESIHSDLILHVKFYDAA